MKRESAMSKKTKKRMNKILKVLNLKGVKVAA
jgi:hypothetical protein